MFRRPVREVVRLTVSATFAVAMVALAGLLVGAVWSIAVPRKRIWPPPARRSWQYLLTWFLFYVVFGANAVLLVIDWNSWVFGDWRRLLLGVPLALLGALLVSWGVLTLGTRNTAGVRSGLVSDGPYRFTRNPQYLGDSLLFIGLSLIANSLHLWIAHALLILVFLLAPLTEEQWLEEQYGQAYAEYMRSVPRFL
jgi:protein-S-isoprenylcysteine O-methyltransferase Ste14